MTTDIDAGPRELVAEVIGLARVIRDEMRSAGGRAPFNATKEAFERIMRESWEHVDG